MQLTQNFSVQEMQCPCCSKCEMDPIFMTRLQALRDKFGRPMPVSSGYRCPLHNKAVKGATNSWHLKGQAADILVATSASRMRLVKAAVDLGFHGIGINASFIHIDGRPALKEAMFLY